MKNYFDFDWTKGTVYAVISDRRLLVDVFNSQNLNTPPVFIPTRDFVVQSNDDGMWVGTFNEFADYRKCFEWAHSTGYHTLIRKNDYDKFISQYRIALGRQIPNKGRLYAEVRGTSFWDAVKGTVQEVSVYFVDGTYTTTFVGVTSGYGKLTDEEDILNRYFDEYDSGNDDCRKNTDFALSVRAHFHSIENRPDQQERYFSRTIENNRKKGYDMCAYCIEYFDTTNKSHSFAITAGNICKALKSELNTKVRRVKTIGFCRSNMEVCKPYKMYFEDGTVRPFVYYDKASITKITSSYVLKDIPFRIDK